MELPDRPVPGCPKRMVHGPCGGVRDDGSCEMVAAPCVFDRPDVPPAGPLAVLSPAPVPSPPSWRPPMVLTDLSVPPADAATLQSTARLLAGTCDALLVGDHQDRVDFPPSTVARLVADAGGVPWVTLACRDRNRIALEQELRALALDGLATVLCVTGDGRAYDVRPDVTQAFDLDGTRLAALAASLGLPVAVAETPTARPVELRPRRLVRKQQVGARVGVLNHVPVRAQLAGFVAAAHEVGLRMPLVGSVVVFTDQRSADVLAALPGLRIAPERLEAVLTADDPVEAGIAAAVDEAVGLLALPGMAGVNLSGLASARGVHAAAEIQAEIGRRIRRTQGVTP
ncbi:methylenetetrahydrofolate reductase C-terminal domain-containing protein [Terrabacter sp. NPDC080008]|uniref:methylenetetrahydrofolate reductase C-terminal domain-containing protein n=1 Tax=Terrabacter sp. NPDC080008 TaxID=3155176 RepID=UPI0034505FDE